MNKTKILIVDDEFAMRYLVERHLVRHDYEVMLARDGVDGLTAALEQLPDLIVLDVKLPDMNGFHLCKKMRESSQLEDVPIIFLTSLMTADHKQLAFEVGAQDYIEKPFMPDEFLSRITAVLQKTSSEQPKENGRSGHITTFFGPKGGVGTTTLAVQFSESMVIQAERPVMLIDLAVPLGGIAPLLNLYTENHIMRLLESLTPQTTMAEVQAFAQCHHNNFMVIPAPGQFVDNKQPADNDRLRHLLQMIAASGFEVVVDVGSHLCPTSLTAMRTAGTLFVVTSGKQVANKMINAFMESAGHLRLNVNRILPVVNQLHGFDDNIELARLPVATIPQYRERAQTRLWLQDNGLRKMLTIVL